MNRTHLQHTVPTDRPDDVARRTRRSLRRRGASAAGLAGIALLGSACIGSSEDDQAAGELGRVDEVVLSETVGDDGVTETITVSVGRPARLTMTTVDSGADLVSPGELEPSDSCLRFATPEPLEDTFRGIGEQDGVELAYFVAEYTDGDAANDAMSGASLCYLDYAAEVAAGRGFEPSVSPHDPLQFLDLHDGEQFEFRIHTQDFDDEGPAVYSARLGSTVATVIDLDNQLDQFDAESLSLQIAELGA